MSDSEEPGTFYIWTETSPRCYIVQKVATRNLDDFMEQIQSRQCRGAIVTQARSHSSRSGSSHGDCGRCPPSPPPIPQLPWWFTPEAEESLRQAGESVVVSAQDFQRCTNGYYESVLCIPYTPQAMVSEETMAEYSMPRLFGSPLEIQVDNTMTMAPESVSSQWTTYPTPPHSAPRTREELLAQLRAQIEFYFSRENLTTDRYLKSQMDNDRYVKIKVLASFPKVQQLNASEADIVEAIKDSKALQLDEECTRVRAVTERCTIILREMPETTDRKELEALFKDMPNKSSTPPHIEYGLNDVWYVSFTTEEECRAALTHLHCNVQTFHGKPIFARIKTGKAPISPMNDSTRKVPTSLPGLLSPQPASTADDITDTGVYTIPTPSWTPSPQPTSTLIWQGGLPTFDLGPILSQAGFVVQSIYRPPTFVEASSMPHSDMLFTTHITTTTPSPSYNYTQRRGNNSRGRGCRGGSTSHRDAASSHSVANSYPPPLFTSADLRKDNFTPRARGAHRNSGRARGGSSGGNNFRQYFGQNSSTPNWRYQRTNSSQSHYNNTSCKYRSRRSFNDGSLSASETTAKTPDPPAKLEFDATSEDFPTLAPSNGSVEPEPMPVQSNNIKPKKSWAVVAQE